MSAGSIELTAVRHRVARLSAATADATGAIVNLACISRKPQIFRR
jgi:hypothetical protein